MINATTNENNCPCLTIGAYWIKNPPFIDVLPGIGKLRGEIFLFICFIIEPTLYLKCSIMREFGPSSSQFGDIMGFFK